MQRANLLQGVINLLLRRSFSLFRLTSPRCSLQVTLWLAFFLCLLIWSIFLGIFLTCIKQRMNHFVSDKSVFPTTSFVLLGNPWVEERAVGFRYVNNFAREKVNICQGKYPDHIFNEFNNFILEPSVEYREVGITVDNMGEVIDWVYIYE